MTAPVAQRRVLAPPVWLEPSLVRPGAGFRCPASPPLPRLDTGDVAGGLGRWSRPAAGWCATPLPGTAARAPSGDPGSFAV